MQPDQPNQAPAPSPVEVANVLPKGDTEDIAAPITDVSHSLFEYIWTKKRLLVLTVGPTIIVYEVLVVAFLGPLFFNQTGGGADSSNNGKAIGTLLVLPLAVIGGWYSKLKNELEAAFLEEFALKNGYGFNQNGAVDETYGSIFRYPGAQKVSDVIAGTFGGHDFRLFLYQLTVGSGRYQQIFQDTVIELDLDGKLPPVFVLNKKSRYGSLNVASVFGSNNTVKLEGDFSQYFTVYVPSGQEVQALAVFSPDVMALMEDESKHLSVELAGNKAYIYYGGFVSSADSLGQMYDLAKKLIVKLGRAANEMKNDSDILQPKMNTQIMAEESSMLGTMTWKKVWIATGVTLGSMIVLGFALYLFLVSPAGQKLQGQNNSNNLYQSQTP